MALLVVTFKKDALCGLPWGLEILFSIKEADLIESQELRVEPQEQTAIGETQLYMREMVIKFSISVTYEV